MNLSVSLYDEEWDGTTTWPNDVHFHIKTKSFCFGKEIVSQIFWLLDRWDRSRFDAHLLIPIHVYRTPFLIDFARMMHD